MNKHIDKIFRLLYEPLVTPYNLLENAKLENYSYVKYYKNKEGLTAEMKCSIDNKQYIFRYEFDKKNHLQKIKKQSKNKEICVYNRKLELEKTRSEYLKIG